MTDDMIQEKMSDLAAQLRRDWRDSRIEFQTFPSGAVMLDVYRDGRQFLLYYMPSDRLFVADEGFWEESFLRSYRFCFEQLEPAVDCLKNLVAGKIQVTPPAAERQAS